MKVLVFANATLTLIAWSLLKKNVDLLVWGLTVLPLLYIKVETEADLTFEVAILTILLVLFLDS